MTLQRWRNRLVEELRRQGLPRGHIERLVQELTDHANDLLSENQSMDAEQDIESRLGTPEQLAAVAKEEFKRRTFLGRHPVLTFIVGPIISLIVTVVGTFQLLVLFYSAIELAVGRELSVGFNNRFFQLGGSSIQFVPFLLSTWLFVRLGHRCGRIAWSKIAIGIIVVAAFMLTSNFTPRIGNTEGSLMLMFGPSTSLKHAFTVSHIVQALVPLALGAWMYAQSSISRFNLHSVE